MSRQGDPAAEVAAWNKANPVGILVEVTKDLGEVVTTTTRSPAQVLGGHSAVIWLHGITGCYLLSRVRPAEVSEKDKGRLAVIQILNDARIDGGAPPEALEEAIEILERRRAEDAGGEVSS